ncbi:hypothetical protein [Streptomyces sp. NPDC102490]|uniref:hypothetical protein n=1 Tax=Streptomyces sp. NPDC102490 TaxID=3366183 RepID=UPI00382D571A
MIPWLRALRATGLVGALGAGAVAAPYSAEPAHAAGWSAVVAAPTPGPSAPGTPTTPDGSGSHDGRGGHEHPHRPDDGDRPDDRPDARPPAESGPADSASPTPSPSSPSPSASGTKADPEPSRGGSMQGEGRQRPGHAEEREPEHDAGDQYAGRRYRHGYGGDDAVPEAPATALPPARTEAAAAPTTAPPRPPTQSRTPSRAAAEPLLRVLPLGTGLVLLGLGLALGLAGLRLRRA